MKAAFYLIFISFVVGCSSSGVNTRYKDVADIKNEDFKPMKQVRYRKSDDYFAQVDSKLTAALNSESIERVYRYDGDSNVKGVLGEIAEKCYKKDFSSAEALIKQENKRYIKNPIFWNQVGTCFLVKGERRKALLFYNKALGIKTNYGPALNNLGVMYMHERDYSRALVAFERAKKAGDFSRTPRFNLAHLYLGFGLYDKAIKEANTLYNSKSQDIDLLNVLATAHVMKGQYKQAQNYYKKIDTDYLEMDRFGINYALNEFYLGNKNKAHDLLSNVDKMTSAEWKEYYLSAKNFLGVRE